MRFILFVEEQSAEEALHLILPNLLKDCASYEVHPFRGKPALLSRLPNRLKGYASWLPNDFKIVVLIDEDRQDCVELKARLERIAADAGLITKTSAEGGQEFNVVNRLAVEELEAWFFGDIEAVCSAYPRVPPSISHKAKFRDPDAITGGTWEALERMLQKYGYHLGGLQKIQAARDIAVHMDPARNTSNSFQVFRDALLELASCSLSLNL